MNTNATNKNCLQLHHPHSIVLEDIQHTVSYRWEFWKSLNWRPALVQNGTE